MELPLVGGCLRGYLGNVCWEEREVCQEGGALGRAGHWAGRGEVHKGMMAGVALSLTRTHRWWDGGSGVALARGGVLEPRWEKQAAVMFLSDVVPKTHFFSFLSLKYPKHIRTPGPLHVPFPLPETLFYRQHD